MWMKPLVFSIYHCTKHAITDQYGRVVVVGYMDGRNRRESQNKRHKRIEMEKNHVKDIEWEESRRPAIDC